MSVRGLASVFLAVLLLLAAGCESWEQPAFEVRVPFAVKYATPSAGHVVTRDVAENLAIFAAFSAPVAPASLDGVAVLRGGAPVEVAVRVGARPQEVIVDHGPLEVGDYEFVLPAGVRSADGDELGIELRIPFRVLPVPEVEL